MQESSSGQQMITAFFDERNEAERAVEQLKTKGIDQSDIQLVAGRSGSEAPQQNADEDKGFFETLKGWFIPEEDRASYAEGLRRGGFIVRVDTDPGRRDSVFDILDDEGTVNMDEREESWRSEGWGGHQAEQSHGGETGTIEVAEEQLRVGKRDVGHGRVRVRSYVVEDEVSEDVTLRKEEVDVERRSVDKPLKSSDKAFEERTIELEEKSEEAVVSKEARVTEEIDVSRDVEDRTETVSDTVRRTEVEIDDERKDQNRKS